MKIHEYQAKEVLARYGVPIPRNAGVASKPEEVRDKVAQLGGKGVLKAQVHTGGRGKAGGIRIASSPEEGETLARQMLGMLLKTHQAPDGLKVEKLLIEEPISIKQEIYAGVVPDRVSKRNVLIVSARGGMDIEAVAAEEPEAVVRLPIDPLEGPHDFEIRQACYKAGLDPVLVNRLVSPLRGLLNAFVGVDASLAEINPLAVTEDGQVVAADAKIELDDSALFRHPDLAAFAEESEEDPLEAQAHRLGIAYVRLKGEVGIICNGAGLTMATMDAVQRAGGRPANFLDVGGGAQSERVKTCLGLVLSDPQVRGVLINIFGGITRCDEVAKGIVMAKNSLEVKVPLVVRLAGTRAEEGAAILAQEGITPAATMPEAAEKIVGLTR